MIKVGLKYGLFAGAFLIGMYMLSFLIGVNPFTDNLNLLFNLVLFSIFVYTALKEYKLYEQEGVLHFWQGMSVGFITYMTGSILFAFALFIHFQLDPNLLIAYKEEIGRVLEVDREEIIEAFGEEIYKQQSEEIQYVTSGELILFSLFKKILTGFFVTPVISLVLRTKLNK